MRPILFSIGWFVAILLVEISFVASLPWPLKVLPLLFAFSIVRVQHRGVFRDVWWIAAGGIALDVLSISPVPSPVSSIASLVVAGAVVLLSRSVFSTRSWYGLMLCGASACAVKALATAFCLYLVMLTSNDPFDWASWGRHTIWESAFALLLLMLAFSISIAIRDWRRPLRRRAS